VQFNEFRHEIWCIRAPPEATILRMNLDGQAAIQAWDYSGDFWDICKMIWVVHGELHGYGHEGVFGPHRMFAKNLLMRCATHLNFYKIEERPDNMVSGGCEWWWWLWWLWWL
jgi:hypothetical protein